MRARAVELPYDAGAETATTYRVLSETVLTFERGEGTTERLYQRDEAVFDAVLRPDPGIGRRMVLEVKQLRVGMEGPDPSPETLALERTAAGRHLLVLVSPDCGSKQVLGLERLFDDRTAARGLDSFLLPLLPCVPQGTVQPGGRGADPTRTYRAAEDGDAETSWDVDWRLLGHEKGPEPRMARFAATGTARTRESGERDGQEIELTVEGPVEGWLRWRADLARPEAMELRVSGRGQVAMVDPVAGESREIPVHSEQSYRVERLETFPAAEATAPSPDEEALFAVGEGMALLQGDRFAEAASRLEAALASPLPLRQELIARISLGTSLYLQGRADEALLHLDRALQVAPNHPLALKVRDAAMAMALGGKAAPGEDARTPEVTVRGFIQACFSADDAARTRWFSRRIPEALVRNRVAPLWDLGSGLGSEAQRRSAAAMVEASVQVDVREETRGTARVEVTGEPGAGAPLHLVFYLVKEDERWAILATEGPAGALILATLLGASETAGDEELSTLLRLVEENLGEVGAGGRYEGLDLLSWQDVPLLARARFARGLIELGLAEGGEVPTPAALEAMRRDDPGGIPTRYLEAMLRASRGESEEARALLEGLRSEGVPLGSVEYQLARLMLRGGEKEAAAGLLEGLRRRDGASWDVLHSLGDVYGQSRDYDRAVASYRAALEVDPGRAVTLNNLAWQYAQRGENLDEGIALVTDAISQEPDNVAFLDTLAELLYRKDQPREALRVIEQALTLQPDAAHLLEQRDRFREAARR